MFSIFALFTGSPNAFVAATNVNDGDAAIVADFDANALIQMIIKSARRFIGVFLTRALILIFFIVVVEWTEEDRCWSTRARY